MPSLDRLKPIPRLPAGRRMSATGTSLTRPETPPGPDRRAKTRRGGLAMEAAMTKKYEAKS